MIKVSTTGMAVSLKTDLRFPASGQQGHGTRIIPKYSKKGVDGLKDGRGRNKSADELSELEKLRAENRLLKAEKKRQQIEIDLLKNSKKSRGGDTAQNKTS